MAIDQKTERRFPYAGHDNGIVLEQPEPGKFTERPMTPGELAAREPALQIAKDIYRHANYAGICYAEIWELIAKAIDSTHQSAEGACKHEPFEGRCVHCNARFEDGKVVSATAPTAECPDCGKRFDPRWKEAEDAFLRAADSCGGSHG